MQFAKASGKPVYTSRDTKYSGLRVQRLEISTVPAIGRLLYKQANAKMPVKELIKISSFIVE